MRSRPRTPIAAWLLLLATLPALAAPEIRHIEQAERHNRFGAEALRLGNVHEAGRHYRRALRLLPGFPEALVGLGHVLMADRRFGEALASYREALEAYGAMQGAVLAMQQARYNRAQRRIVMLRDAIQDLRSPSIGRKTSPGTVQRKILELESEIAMLEGLEQPEADRRRKAPGEIHFHIGNALHRLGRTDEALAAWRLCVEKAPAFPTAHNNLAVALWQLGRVDEARRHLERAEALGFPVNPAFRDELDATRASR